jgi:hypothetical protein
MYQSRCHSRQKRKMTIQKGDKKNKQKIEQKEPLTKEEFFRVLNKVIRPISEKKQEPEKKETSE